MDLDASSLRMPTLQQELEQMQAASGSLPLEAHGAAPSASAAALPGPAARPVLAGECPPGGMQVAAAQRIASAQAGHEDGVAAAALDSVNLGADEAAAGAHTLVPGPSPASRAATGAQSSAQAGTARALGSRSSAATPGISSMPAGARGMHPRREAGEHAALGPPAGAHAPGPAAAAGVSGAVQLDAEAGGGAPLGGPPSAAAPPGAPAPPAGAAGGRPGSGEGASTVLGGPRPPGLTVTEAGAGDGTAGAGIAQADSAGGLGAHTAAAAAGAEGGSSAGDAVIERVKAAREAALWEAAKVRDIAMQCKGVACLSCAACGPLAHHTVQMHVLHDAQTCKPGDVHRLEAMTSHCLERICLLPAQELRSVQAALAARTQEAAAAKKQRPKKERPGTHSNYMPGMHMSAAAR